MANGMSAPLKDPVWKHARRRMYFVQKESPVAEAAKVMKTAGVGSVIVQDGAKAVGIITLRDLIDKVVAEGKNPSEVKAASVMSSPLVTVGMNVSLEKALNLMEEKEIRRVVVLDKEGKPFGILVEMKVCGDFLDRQYRKGEARERSWLEELIEDVTDHQLGHRREMEQDSA